MTGILNLLMGTVRSAGVTADPYFEYTTLLLPGSGTNGTQNNSFVDSSANAFPITRNPLTGPNAPTQGTFSPFSQTGWGNYFSGSSAFGTSDVATDFQSGDFTIEAWVYLSSLSTVAPVVNGFNTSVGLQITTNAELELFQWTGSAYSINIKSSVSAVALNTWVHVVGVRSGSNASVYVNGSRLATSTTVSGTQVSTGSTLIGRNSGSTRWVSGYISNLRIVKGTAVYDPTQTTLTVPTSPLTAITNTSLLTCQSNRFIDNSTNNYSISLTGTPTVVAFSPFNPTASWSAATYGGSGYFDGNGDYLTAPSNAAFAVGSVFTIEFWLYPISAGANPVYIYLNENTGSLQFGLNGGTLSLAAAGVAWRLIGSKGPVTNAWNHCVLVRSGTGTNQTSIFLNGERIANGTVTDAWTTDVQAIIQSTLGTSYQTNGYMSGVRIVKGTAVYDPTLTSLTVPTAPLTAITNTSLLLNFTNAGIYDATSKNDLETVGNAQISNAVTPQFGSTSIKFNGTTDYLSAPDSPLFSLGSANFTIECWFRSGSFASGQFFVSQWNSASYGYGFSIANSTTVKFEYYSSGVYTNRSYTVPTFSTNTWYHIAWVRYNGTTTVYIDGVARGTPTSDNVSITDSTRPLLIGINGDGNNQYFNGYIQDLRITPSIARYTANFTPPTAAFPTL